MAVFSHTIKAGLVCLTETENQIIKRDLRDGCPVASNLNDLRLPSFLSKNSRFADIRALHVKFGEQRYLGKSEPRRKALLLRTFCCEEQKHSPDQLSPGKQVLVQQVSLRPVRGPWRGHGRPHASLNVAASEGLFPS